jgi:hypothetical protein
VAQAIADSLELKEVWGRVAGACRTVVPFDGMGVAQLEGDRTRTLVVAGDAQAMERTAEMREAIFSFGVLERGQETFVKKRALVSRRAMAVPILVAGLGAGAGRVAAQDVSVDYDRGADFSGCGTYAWAEGQPAENPLVDKRIVEAIDRSLAAKGCRKVPESPGWYVTYRASAREQKELRVWDTGWRFRGMGTVDLKTALNGMLVVDIKDGATRELVWRGVA